MPDCTWDGDRQPRLEYQSEMSEILHGRRVTNDNVLVRIAEDLGVTRGLIGLAYDAPDSKPPHLHR